MPFLPTALTSRPRALVTGGTGFIGSHLVRYLEQQGWVVHLLVRSQPTSFAHGLQWHAYTGHIEDVIKALDQSRPNVVFHLASLFLAQHSATQISGLVQANIMFGTQLLEAMQTVGVQALVNTGTSWQHFGRNTYRPVNLYAATKQAFEDILAFYCDTGAVRSVTLKLFDTYGPGDHRKKLLRLLLEASKTKTELELSGGQQEIDLVHVDDLSRAFLQAARLVRDAEQPACASYAISGGERRSLRDIVALLEEFTGSIPVQWGARPYRTREVMELWEGPALPGWKPEIGLREGFRLLLRERLP